ncbi:MAG: nucleoid-associated protein [Bacteroidota bacterium]
MSFTIAAIKDLIVHHVGNKTAGEDLSISRNSLSLTEEIQHILLQYFLKPFKTEELYTFYHDTNLSLNEVYTYVTEIFSNPESTYQQSIHIAKHLYNQSIHPNTKGGELYVVHFNECIFRNEVIDAIGIFKSENKDTFLEVEQLKDDFEIESRQGININKLDKGCLIFNTSSEAGYVLSIIDNTNKGNEAQYWKDQFLSVQIQNNEYHQTNQFLGIAKQFVTKQLEQEFEVNQTDKIDLLNRSVDYFKSHDNFNKKEFEEEVFADSGIIKSFRKFDQSYRTENEVELSDSFEISTQAVKKQARVFKSVLKLDKNFHVYIHGNRDMIEQGIDENGRKFYKIYYQEER